MESHSYSAFSSQRSTCPASDHRPGHSRRALAGFVAVLACVVWSHALAGVLRLLFAVSAQSLADSATGISVAAALAALAGVVASVYGAPLFWALLSGLIGAAVGGVALALANPAIGGCAASVVPATLAALACGHWVGPRLPNSMDAVFAAARPFFRMIWWAAAVLAVVQTARLSTWITDPSSDWFVSTRHPFFAKHECANAYVFGAELALRAEPNVYDAHHYPGIHPAAEPVTKVPGLSPEDPYQYPPQFLLAPALALKCVPDYHALKSLWFGVNVTLCLGAVLVLACWVSGRVGGMAALLVPAASASFPVLYDFQYGQFHFAAVALAILGWVAAHQRRPAIAGALLTCAILSKLFPGVLLVPLAVSRRWRALGWTAACSLVATAATVLSFGLAPLRAFFSHHVERLVDGRAFAFDEAWPDFASLLIAGNQGVRGIVEKLAAMGVDAAGPAAGDWAVRFFCVALVALAVRVGLRDRRAERAEHALAGLGLIGLGSLVSAGAWADYVPLTCVLLLGYLVPLSKNRPLLRGWIYLCAPFQLLLLGAVPLGAAASPRWMLPGSMFGALAMLVTFALAVGRPWPERIAVGGRAWRDPEGGLGQPAGPLRTSGAR